MAKHVALKSGSLVRRLASALLAIATAATGVGLWIAPASAAEFDVAEATMDFNEDTQARVLYRGYPGGTTTNYAAGASSGTAGELVGDRVLYKNVITIGGTQIDALIKTTFKTSGLDVTAFDGGNAVSGARSLFQTNIDSGRNSKVTFSFTFYVSGSYNPETDTGTVATLRNVLVNSYDLDDSASGSRQYSEMTGFQSYTLSSNTTLAVSSASGFTRFQDNTAANNTNYSSTSGSYTKGRVQVKFNYLTSFEVSHGVDDSGSGGVSYFALDFGPGFGWTEGSTVLTTATVDNTAGNRPPTSTDVTTYVGNGIPRALELSDFGSYSDPDLNPLVSIRIDSLPTLGSLEKWNGSSWGPVTGGDVFTPAQVADGSLRFTPNSPSSSDNLTFSVFDGLVHSTAVNILTFVPAAASQVITFSNPGSKQVNQTIASGATSDSGLTVTLTSNTPGICSVSGLDIVILSNFGSCSITASQPGNASFASATSVTQVFQVAASVTNYTITYAGNSNTSGSAPSATTGSGNVLLAAQGNLVRENFTFGGWLIDGETYAAGANYNLTADVTATAIWNAVPLAMPEPSSDSPLLPGLAETGFVSIPLLLASLLFSLLGTFALVYARRRV